jgi:signal transduction histidine kinase
MHLDPVTLLWVLNLCYLINILYAVALYFGGSSFPGARFWILAQGIIAVGTMLLAQRQVIPYPMLALGNSLMVLSYILFAQAVWRFRRFGRFPVQVYGLVVLFYIAMLLMQDKTINSRSILFSGANAISAIMVFILFIKKQKDDHAFALMMAGIPFLLIATGNLIQLVNGFIMKPTHVIEGMGLLYSVIILFSIVTASMSLFGYFLLSITHKQKDLEEQQSILIGTNAELRRINHLRDVFVAMMAHDLRAPIGGAARYMRKNLLAPDIDLRDKYASLETLAASLEKTTHYLESILWWGRSQLDDMAIQRLPINLSEIAANTLAMMKPFAMEKNITLDMEAIPVTIALADPESVALIAQNLVSNAIKFSHPGSRVLIECGQDHAELPFLRITDQGVGIPQAIRERLFQLERKVSTVGTAGELGNGMGLILCWEFAKKNAAKLVLTSDPGIGTTVSIQFQPALTAFPG